MPIQPESVIYDADLLATLPPNFAATSGMNAVAHAVEGPYAVDGNPIISLMAEEAFPHWLPRYPNPAKAPTRIARTISAPSAE